MRKGGESDQAVRRGELHFPSQTTSADKMERVMTRCVDDCSIWEKDVLDGIETLSSVAFRSCFYIQAQSYQAQSYFDPRTLALETPSRPVFRAS